MITAPSASLYSSPPIDAAKTDVVERQPQARRKATFMGNA
jgi:hypothetical protein